MRSSTHILLIEDNPADVRLIQEYLRGAEVGRYKLFHSDTLEGAGEILATERVDLVLLDLHLPDSLGFDTFDQVFPVYYAYPIIVLTGLKDEDLGIRAVKRGAQDFLNKNDLTSQVLTRAIRYAIERHQMLRRLDQAQRLAKMGSWEHDLASGALFCSPEVYAIFETGPEFRLKTFQDYVRAVFQDDQERVETEFQKALEQGGVFRVDHRVQLSDGSFKFLTMQGQAENDQVNRLERLVGTIQDITDRRAFEELSRKKELAEQTARLKQEFLANTSHEIRTPLNAILQLTELLGKDDLNSQQQEYLTLIRNAGGTLLAVVNDILDLAKIEANKIDFTHTTFSLNQVVNSMTSLLEIKALGEELKLTSHIDPDIPLYLVGDPVRLNQILINLVNNAIKFTREGSVKVEARLLKKQDQEVTIHFSVIDTGIGIAQDKLSTIFESFKRIETDFSQQQGGTGLGLTIVKQLVMLQGGEIAVESEPGMGSTFSFSLPFTVSESGETQMPLHHPISIDKDLVKGKKILIVEDNSLNQLVTQRILDDWGIEVSIASNGAICLEKLEEDSFDLVLMDVQMPVMDGYEATRRIRQDLPEPARSIPIIALTANAFSGMDDECIKAGMDDYISKPFQTSILFGKIVDNLNREAGEDSWNLGPEKPSAPSDGKKSPLGIPLGTSHVDLSYLHEVSGGDQEMIHSVIQSYLTHTPTLLAKMNHALDMEAYLELARYAHKLKGTITTIGVKDLRQEIERLEHISKNPVKPEDIPPLMEHVCFEIERSLRELSTLRLS